MYKNKKIAVVVPAYNEEILIGRTISTMPDLIDHIVVVDDKSKDKTLDILQKLALENKKLIILAHEKNRGCGAARSTAYSWCVDNEIDIIVGVDADGQMDSSEIEKLITPIVEGKADYSKGNRLITGEAWQIIPKVRYLGNSFLTLMTKMASGYWHVTDSQTGFNAISGETLKMLPFKTLYARYGWPNHLLVMLNIYNQRVVDVPVRPIYGIGEKSGIRIWRIIFTMSFLIMRLFLKRMVQKYIIRDFHPLIFFYALGFSLIALDIPLIIRLLYYLFETGKVFPINALTIVFCTFMGMQSLLFAMLFDMEANKGLKG